MIQLLHGYCTPSIRQKQNIFMTDDIRWHDIQTNFHENSFSGLKLESGNEILRHIDMIP